eukprot:3796031-Rhodomonas_salina.1
MCIGSTGLRGGSLREGGRAGEQPRRSRGGSPRSSPTCASLVGEFCRGPVAAVPTELVLSLAPVGP